MRKNGYLLATAGAIGAAAGSAHAADLPMKAPPPAPVPVAPSWTGFYVGVNAGAGWQTGKGTYSGSEQYDSLGTSMSGTAAGFTGGGQIGYNWQFSQYVLGVEADIEGLAGQATFNSGFYGEPKGNGLQARISWLSTYRGRAGFLITPNVLVYGTGGLAIGGVNNKFAPNGINASSMGTTKSVSKTQAGWVAGGGVEAMIDKHWIAGLEVLYANLGSTTGMSA